MTQMLRIGTCGVCGTGNIGIRVAASARRVVGMCDECDAVWMDPKLQDGPHFPKQPELTCHADGSSLRHAPAHWASRAEASAAGWAGAVLGETETIG
jgi:hypothetical protein